MTASQTQASKYLQSFLAEHCLNKTERYGDAVVEFTVSEYRQFHGRTAFDMAFDVR